MDALVRKKIRTCTPLPLHLAHHTKYHFEELAEAVRSEFIQRSEFSSQNTKKASGLWGGSPLQVPAVYTKGEPAGLPLTVQRPSLYWVPAVHDKYVQYTYDDTVPEDGIGTYRHVYRTVPIRTG